MSDSTENNKQTPLIAIFIGGKYYLSFRTKKYYNVQ